MITITGLGDHDQPDWLITMAGIRSLTARRGALRAAVAVGHKILVAAYRMLASGSDYKDLGAGYLDQLNHHRAAGNMLRRLRQMGYDVQITPRAA